VELKAFWNREETTTESSTIRDTMGIKDNTQRTKSAEITSAIWESMGIKTWESITPI
jgi:hypothetical protein